MTVLTRSTGDRVDMNGNGYRNGVGQGHSDVVSMEMPRETAYAPRILSRNNNTNGGFSLRPITATGAVEQNGQRSTALPKMVTEDKRPITATPKISAVENGVHMPKVPMVNNFMTKTKTNGKALPRGKRHRSRTGSVYSDAESRLSVVGQPRRSTSFLPDRKTRKVSEVPSIEEPVQIEHDPHGAWNSFVQYIQSIHVAPTYIKKQTDKTPETRDEDYGLLKDCRTSSVFRKTFDELKKRNQKTNRMNYLRNLVSMKNIAELNTVESNQNGEHETSEADSDGDSIDGDDEYSKSMSYGKIGWSIIRSYVRGKVLERKESRKSVGFNWNVLRQQLLAMSNMERHRQDLYTRYGIIPPVGSRVARSSMLVEVSAEAKEVLEKYKNPARAMSATKPVTIRNKNDTS